MLGARSAGTEMYIDVHEDSEHRATPQLTTTAVLQQPVKAIDCLIDLISHHNIAYHSIRALICLYIGSAAYLLRRIHTISTDRIKPFCNAIN